VIGTATASAADAKYGYSGHIKYRSVLTDYPSDSLYQDFIDDPAWDNTLNLRLNGTVRKDAWGGRADYQLFTLHGDSVKLFQQHPGLGLISGVAPDDRFRVMDLTHIINESSGSITGQRLDRFYFDHTTEQTVVRVGRQAISWGNGLFYNPMDFFNPFDPAAIDNEYKTGDDMIYAQYLNPRGLYVVTVFLEVLGIKNVNAGLVFGVNRRRIKWINDIHGGEKQAIAPGERPTSCPQYRVFARIPDPQSAQSVQ